jgi:hypothetical protein
MFSVNKFSKRVFNFEKKYQKYDDALSNAGITLPGSITITPMPTVTYDYSGYIYSF